MNTQDTIKQHEELLNGWTISRLESDGWQGMDACLETSLFGYGFAYLKDDKGEYQYICAISWNDDGDAHRFDNGFILESELNFECFDWCDDDFKNNNQDLLGKIALLPAIASHYSNEDAYGSCYHSGHTILTEEHEDALKASLEAFQTILG